MVSTTIDIDLHESQVSTYFKSLVNKIFKILPSIENNDPHIMVYMDSLKKELEGFQSLIPEVAADPLYISILSIYKWMIDNIGDAEEQYKTFRREIFNAISMCKKLESRYIAIEGEVVRCQDSGTSTPIE